MSCVDRQTLEGLLEDWQKGRLSPRDVHERAEQIWEAHDDWPRSPGEPGAILAEVVSNLDVLNHQLITKEDIPAFLEFLRTPPGQEAEAWDKWRRYWDAIDFEERERQFGDSLYGPEE